MKILKLLVLGLCLFAAENIWASNFHKGDTWTYCADIYIESEWFCECSDVLEVRLVWKKDVLVEEIAGEMFVSSDRKNWSHFISLFDLLEKSTTVQFSSIQENRPGFLMEQKVPLLPALPLAETIKEYHAGDRVQLSIINETELFLAEYLMGDFYLECSRDMLVRQTPSGLEFSEDQENWIPFSEALDWSIF